MDGRESASMGSPPGGGVSAGDYCGCRRRYTQRRVSRDPGTGQYDCAGVHTHLDSTSTTPRALQVSFVQQRMFEPRS